MTVVLARVPVGFPPPDVLQLQVVPVDALRVASPLVTATGRPGTYDITAAPNDPQGMTVSGVAAATATISLAVSDLSDAVASEGLASIAVAPATGKAGYALAGPTGRPNTHASPLEVSHVHGGASIITADLPVTLTGVATAAGLEVYDVAVSTGVPTARLGWIRTVLLRIDGARALPRLPVGAELVTDMSADGHTVLAGNVSDNTIGMRSDPANYLKPGVSGLFQLLTAGEDATQPGDIYLTPVTIRGTLAAERARIAPSDNDGSGFVLRASQRDVPLGLRAGAK